MSDNKYWLSSVLEEYKALRAEVNTASDRQYPIINWGLTSVAVLIAGMATNWEKLWEHPYIQITLAFFVLPLLCTSYIVAWSKILVRMARVGSYIFLIEKKIGSLAKPSKLDFSIRDAEDLEAAMKKDEIPAEKRKSKEGLKEYFHEIQSYKELAELPIGWEHNLWKARSHEYIKTAPIAIRRMLLAVYGLCGSFSLAILLLNIIKGFRSEDFNWLMLGLLIGYVLVLAVIWITAASLLFKSIRNDVKKAEDLRGMFGLMSLKIVAENGNDKDKTSDNSREDDELLPSGILARRGGVVDDEGGIIPTS